MKIVENEEHFLSTEHRPRKRYLPSMVLTGSEGTLAPSGAALVHDNHITRAFAFYSMHCANISLLFPRLAYAVLLSTAC